MDNTRTITQKDKKISPINYIIIKQLRDLLMFVSPLPVYMKKLSNMNSKCCTTNTLVILTQGVSSYAICRCALAHAKNAQFSSLHGSCDVSKFTWEREHSVLQKNTTINRCSCAQFFCALYL